jgi:hypothetical protein
MREDVELQANAAMMIECTREEVCHERSARFVAVIAPVIHTPATHTAIPSLHST